MATKLYGSANQRFARIPEVQRLHLAKSGQAVSGQVSEGISLQLGKSLLHIGPGTSAAKADFFSGFAAGLKACSNPCRGTKLHGLTSESGLANNRLANAV